MWKFIKSAGICMFLFICGVQDIKEKRISVKVFVLFGVLFLIGSFAFDDISWERRAQNMLPGMVVFLLAFLTREQIGYGDAACMAILGSVVSGDILWGAIMGGLFLLSICSIVLLLKKKADRKTTMPFIPFLAAGMLWQMVWR